MKIIRSKGQSFTIVADNRISRGLRLSRGGTQTLRGAEISPAELRDFIADEPDLLVRQTISGFDKVIRKPRRQNLRNFAVTAYVDRTLLSVELWKRIEAKIRGSGAETDADGPAVAALKDRWLWKVHPYAEHPFNPNNPRGDKNAEIIVKYGDKTVADETFHGRWHKTLWRTTATGRPDYDATAAAIWAHLFERELKISGEERQKDRATTEGLVQRRGRSIASSASYPGGDKDDDSVLESAAVMALYFSNDIAAAILKEALASVQRNAQFSRTNLGELLYKHFGIVLSKTNEKSPEREAAWKLHNIVRQFYQEIGRSERFVRAIRDADLKKIGDLLPHDKSDLINVLTAKSRNADFSALIRLGKLVAHATDIRGDEPDVSAAFSARFQYLLTSDGQGEIKRNEAFTRIWRTSVALSLRTLQVLAPVDRSKLKGDVDDDAAGSKYAIAAIRSYDAATYRGRMELIFGAKEIEAESPKARTRALLQPTGDVRRDSEAGREILWALLRIAGEIRNRTNHFNTKDRLLAVLESCPVKRLEDLKQGADNRRPEEVHPVALDALDRLLKFDIGLRRRGALDDLERLGVRKYVVPGRIDDLYGELAQTPTSFDLAMPKFISVLRRAGSLCNSEEADVPEWLRPFGALDLTGLSRVTEGVNHFKVGLLRQLYSSGFAVWLAEKAADTELIRGVVREVAEFKRKRVHAYFAKGADHHRTYAIAESRVDTLGLDECASLSELLRRLQVEATSDESLRRTYRANAGRQRERMKAVDELRIELFIRLFGEYLRDAGLSWLWDVSAALPVDQQDDAAKLEEFPAPRWPDEILPWHSQFYAWLYLVPVDDAALLRHQFRRTAALEGKAGAGSQQTLAELDRLMGLYLSVNAIGFNGREHVQALDCGKLFYERPEQFDLVYSEANETHHVSLPGTRRGLRQILRMDHHKALEGIFDKHKITSEEVDGFASLKSEDVHRLLETKNELSKDIIRLSKERSPDLAKLRPACESYRETVTKLALYNSQVAGARLTEHARLHQLMMRVLGRLADFTLMWERDRQYVFLGMLYQMFGASAFTPTRGPDGAIVLAVPESLRATLLAAVEAGARDREQSGRRASRIRLSVENQMRDGFLPLWDAKYGYMLEGDGVELALLSDAQRRVFVRYFGQIGLENPRDAAARKRRLAEGVKTPPPRRDAPDFKVGKRQIRNDFAHFNVIGGGRRPNLTYLMNAVRSLVAHDRKLKNAVSRAVADIVRDEGLDITWELDGDRLKRPTVLPILETHLTMVRPSSGFDPRFALPHASVRFTSMVKALFDFDPGGYRAAVHRDGKLKNRGELRYPDAFFQMLEQNEIAVPPSVLAQKYQILPQD